MNKIIFTIVAILLISGNVFAQDFNALNNISGKTFNELKVLGDPTQIGPDGLPLYVKGMVFIKIKPGLISGFDENSKLQPNTFGIAELDAFARKSGISKFQQTFNLAPVLSPRVLKRNLPPSEIKEELIRIFTVQFDSQFSLTQILKKFKSRPEVEYVEPVPLYYIFEIPNDPNFSQQQHFNQMFCPQAWDIHKGQKGDQTVLIGICDTGVDWQHNDLTGNLFNNLGEDADHDGHTIEWNGTSWVLDPGDINGIDDDNNGYIDDLSGWNFWTADGTLSNNIKTTSSNAHGTHCAGISAGVTNNAIGIASISWNVKFIGTKHGDNRYGNAIYYGFDGIIYNAEIGADVVNCSWGGGGFSQTGQTAINYATSLGCIVVAAAGNNNSGNAFYPAAYDNVLSVASVAVTDRKAYYSNYGFTVDVSAPGGDAYVDGGILSTIPGNNYAKFQGTSMAAPQVTGLVGYLKSYLPYLSNDVLIRRILTNADPIDAINPSFVGKLGSGRINALNTLLFENNKKLPLKLVTNGIYTQKVADYYNVSFDISNYSMDGANQVKFELMSNDPSIEIMSQYGYGQILPNGTTKTPYLVSFRIVNQEPRWATLTLKMTSIDNPIIAGDTYNFNVYCGENAIFVYEKYANGPTTSGTYIRDYLNNNRFQNVVYSNADFSNLIGFKYVFLSMGNGDSYDFSAFDKIKAEAVSTYLREGGKLYLESSEALGYEQAGNVELLNLFGIAEGFDGIQSHTFAGLMGSPQTITDGMFFPSTSQYPYGWIDNFNLSSGQNAFFEPGIGIVGVQNRGDFGQMTFVFSYAMSKLNDAAFPSTKVNLMQNLLKFFGLYNLAPTAVQLNIPQNNQIIGTNSNIEFSWMPLDNTWDYHLQISQFEDFRTTFYDDYVTDLSIAFNSNQFFLNSNYYWRVQGQNNFGIGPWSEIRTFKVADLPPAKPILTAPQFNISIQEFRPTFQWEAVEGALSYTLEIARTPNFTVGYQKFTNIYQNNFYMYSPLAHNYTYYWKVTAKNQAGSGPASDVWTFKVYMCAGVPTLVTPINNAENQLTTMTFTWNPVEYAQSYDLQISEFPDFSATMDYNGLTSNSWTMNNELLTNKTYYWKVRSFNNCGYSAYSEPYSFSTDIIPFQINLVNKQTCMGSAISLGNFVGDELITVTGGSGIFEYTWTPNAGLVNANTGNPIVTNPISTKTYTLTVKDLITGLVLSKSMILTVYTPLNFYLPFYVFLPYGQSLDLNTKISTIYGGKPPYRIYWFDDMNNLLNPPIINPPLGTYTYKVIVTDANACTKTKNLMLIVTSMKKNIGENTVAGNKETSIMTTYPSPVKDFLNLNITTLQASEMRFEISDLIGKTHLTEVLGTHQSLETRIDLNKLTRGVYILNVFVGEEIISQKIIKE